MQISTQHTIIGLSLSGIGAALELASAGRSVSIFEPASDTALPDVSIIAPTPLNPEAMSGIDFQQLAIRTLKERGIQLIGSLEIDPPEVVVDPASSELVFVEQGRGSLRTRSCVFSPNGRELGLTAHFAPERLYGCGLSHSAWSDAEFYKGRAVAIVGCGAHALDQAAIAAENASSVTVICRNQHLTAPQEIQDRVAEAKSIFISVDTDLKSILQSEDNKVGGVLLEDGTGERSLPVAAIFVANDPVVDWRILGGEEKAKLLVDQQRVFVAGLAAGIDYSDHAKLYADGIRAARLCASADM